MDTLKHEDKFPGRVAIYARYSSEAQNEISLEDQVQRCQEEIAKRGGRIAGTYTDSAQSGWSLNRDGFQEMRTAAEHGKFDAIMFWKFDRLARDHTHIVMITYLLRHEHGLKLYCVEGISQDDDDSAYSMLVEQMIAVFSSFYSRNLSSDTKRAKRGRALRGQFNGSVAPIGYTLVKKSEATAERPAGLHVDSEIAPIVVEAFEKYATRNFSDRAIAEWMNKQPLIERLRKGNKPVGKEMVRDMLQNKVYTGHVPYSETIYGGASLGQKRKSSRGRKAWFEGNHEAIIDDELFTTCQTARAGLVKRRKTQQQSRTYILPGQLYCAHCTASDQVNLVDANYGKMRISWHNRDGVAHYRCISRDRGYGVCNQPYVLEENVLDQLVQEITRLNVRDDSVAARIEEAVKSRSSHEEAFRQMQELKEQQERVQLSWENGLLSPEEYLEKMHQLENQISAVRPLDIDTLEQAADLITYFKAYWDQCDEVDNPTEARQQLMAKIIDRVFVYDDKMMAVALHPDFGMVLDVPEAAPNDVMTAVSWKQKEYNREDSQLYPVRERRGVDHELGATYGRLEMAYITS